MKILITISAIFAALLLSLTFIEAMSICPNFELRPATVIKVVPDTRGFIGHSTMTIVKFEDDYVTEVGGDKGNPGDKVLVHRQFGLKSVFGILGDN